VERRLVELIGKRRQDVTLGRRSVSEHGQRLIGMRGQHDLIELLNSPVTQPQLHVVREPSHMRDRAVSMHSVA